MARSWCHARETAARASRFCARVLPQQHAYDLVYRHGLDIDTDGATLAFGSTTGNLFVSEDQGDNWHNVSHYLPPIYCLRFVN